MESLLPRFLQSTENHFGSANKEYAEYCINRLALCYRNVSVVKESVETHNHGGRTGNDLVIEQDLSDLLECISEMFAQWQEYLSTIDVQDAGVRYRAPVQPSSGVRGRPPFVIAKDQLVYLNSLRFSWSDIASLLGVSRMTVYRRRRDYGMLDEPSRSMSEGDLYQLIKDLRSELPNVGEAMVIGRLRSLGYYIILGKGFA